jgi:hypothetical protein
MKKSIPHILFLLLALLATSGGAAPSMRVNGNEADYQTFHYYVDESAGQEDSIAIEFWPGEGNVQTAELFSNLNRRDLATLYPPDASQVVAGDGSTYYGAYTMQHAGGGRYTITMPVRKCGAYRMTCRYKVNGDPNWRWYGRRDAAVVVSDVAVRDLILYELQVNAVDATGDNYAGRSTFDSLHDNWRFNLDYVKSVGANTLWLMPFHPIGSRADGNYGELGSPYSIKNMWQVGEHLGSTWDRGDAMYDFQQFMAAAEAKGVNIMFDTIFNHTAKDAEIERNPENPQQVAANPWEQIRFTRWWWYSKYTGNGSCFWNDDRSSSPPYEYWSSANSSAQVGPAPADRHDFGKWCDTIDLFWGTYSALGSPANEDDGVWTANNDVKKMTAYYAEFFRYWLEKTGNSIDGFRCDFAQGLPPAAWEYLVNKAKSIKPELAFMAESLDGGAVSKRAGRQFDIINDSWVWGMLGSGDTAPGIRGIVDERRAAYGYAGLMRGLINHDQSAPADKWYTCSRYAVGCALDGAPQMFMGQELGYTDHYGFSRFRYEFGRYTPAIRDYYNMEALWNDRAPDHDALFSRYAEVNKGRQRSNALRLANQYYLDQVRGYGPHNGIFSVLKYDKYGWDAAHQDVVLCFVNLQPGVNNMGTFNANVPAIYLNPTRLYNVRNLASSRPDATLWPTARTGADIAQNGIFVSFPGVFSEGGVAQFLKLEEQSAQLWVGDTYTYPANGSVTSNSDVWVNTETAPIAPGQAVYLHWRVGDGAWQTTSMAWDYNDTKNSHWHYKLGKFPAGSAIEYYVRATQGSQVAYDNRGGANYQVAVTYPTLHWAGNAYQWPPNDQLDAGDNLWINLETWPKGAATAATVVYSTDGVNWLGRTMSKAGTHGNNDWWNVNLLGFPSGAHIRYAIAAKDGNNKTIWVNNGGNNYHAYVK